MEIQLTRDNLLVKLWKAATVIGVILTTILTVGSARVLWFFLKILLDDTSYGIDYLFEMSMSGIGVMLLLLLFAMILTGHAAQQWLEWEDAIAEAESSEDEDA